MSTVKKHQKTFILQLLFALIVVLGKATFLNMSRYSSMSEKRFKHWYRRAFYFFTLNWLILSGVLSNSTEKIAALDASFMRKSGNKTDRLGKFWRGCTNRSERGLELSLLGVVDLKSNTAYALDAKQAIDEDNKSRVDLYAEQVVSLAKTLLQKGIQYLAVDAYYFKEKFVTDIVETGWQSES